MALPGFLQKYFPLGTVLVTECNPKNEAMINRLLKKHRYKPLFAKSYEEAEKILLNKKPLGALLDHTFREDSDHTGLDVVKFVRKKNRDGIMRGFPLFLVASIETIDLIEYEHLDIHEYFDTEMNTVGHVIEETIPYFLERD